LDFFVSHAGPDRAWAEWVAWQLVEAGYTVELDSWDWVAGENVIARMRDVLDGASRVIALLSRAYFEDQRYTTEEWSSALLKVGEGVHRLVPLHIERCAVPRLLGPLLRVELFDVDEAEASKRLVEAVRGPRRPDGKPVFPGQGSAGMLSRRGEAGPRLPGLLPPVWNVGPRNPGFVGRDDVLAGVRERLRAGGTALVQALHGMGGVGKTQLAIEYAYRYAADYDLVWWVTAEDTDLIGERYAALAAELNLTAPYADTAAAVNALRAYLRGHDRWLLVLDNAESPHDVRDWLPAGPGHIVITSRNPGWGELAARVEVDVLPRPESTALLRAYRPGLGDAEADRLADALGDLPLALAQAAGFLAETGIPAMEYLDLLRTNTEELLDQSPPQAHPHSLAAAIRISTDRLACADPAALALLRVAAFLAPEPIPAEVLTARVSCQGHGGPPELAALSAAVTSPVAAHRSLGTVGRYGLARVEDGFQVHRLTQAVVRSQLPDDQAAAYRAYAEALLVAADPGDERDAAAWPLWARLLPHLLATDPASSPSPELRDLACRTLRYLWDRGDNQLARDLARHLYQSWRDRFGPDDQHALRATHTLVLVLTLIGPYGQARQIGEDTLTRSRRILGDDHPRTLTAAHVLANCLRAMGELVQARQLNEDTLARRRRVSGVDHAATKRSAHNLGRDLRALGEVQQARRLHEDGVAYARRMLLGDHPETINAAIELGVSLHAAGDVEAARQLHDETILRAQRILGDDHANTLDAANGLVRDLHVLGEVEAARQLAEDTFARTLRVLGVGSYQTIAAANNLAAVLNTMGDFEVARQLGKENLARAQRAFGDNHPHTLRAAENLATAQAGVEKC
jgi:hypothetical protein